LNTETKRAVDIQTEKLQLIEALAATQDAKMVVQIKELLKGKRTTTQEMQARARESLADITEGKVKKAAIFIKEVEAWKKKKRSSIG
jgi:hypothetical protein